MNKIPFTSQNPYAFYAKTIDSYDTETNTREAKKRKKNKTQESLKEDWIFFSPPVCKWETPVWLTYSIHEASKWPFWHKNNVALRSVTLQPCDAVGCRCPNTGFLRHRCCFDTHKGKQKQNKTRARVRTKTKGKIQALSFFFLLFFKTGKNCVSVSTFFFSQVPVQTNEGVYYWEQNTQLHTSIPLQRPTSVCIFTHLDAYFKWCPVEQFGPNL